MSIYFPSGTVATKEGLSSFFVGKEAVVDRR